jgi:hypothetical protein
MNWNVDAPLDFTRQHCEIFWNASLETLALNEVEKIAQDWRSE